MAYSKQQWKDEIPDLTKPIKDASGKQKTDPQTGRPLYELVQEGTRITSARLNHIEDGMEGAHTQLAELSEDIKTHASDGVKHLTAAERTAWNAKETPAAAQQKADASLASAKSYTDTQLLTKADKSTTYSKTETDQRIQNVVGAAPAALDTLKEIGDALNNDPNFAATMTTQLSGKVDKIPGKQLSTEDFTSSEKTKLAGLTAGAGGAGSASDAVIGNRTIADTTAPTGDTGTISTLLGWLANMIKSITGKSSWRTAPATTLEAAKIHADDNTRHLTAAERTTWNAKETTGGAQAKADAVQTNLTAHAGDNTRHITAAERTDWNAKETPGGAKTKADAAEAAAKAASIPLAQKGVAGGVAALNTASQVIAKGAVYDRRYMRELGNFHFENGVANQKVDIFITGEVVGYLDINITGNWENAVAVGNLTKRLSVHAVNNPMDYQVSEYISVNGPVREHLSISDLKWDESTAKWKVTIESRRTEGNTYSVFADGMGRSPGGPTFALGQVYTGAATTLPKPVQVIPDDTTTVSGYKVLNSADTSTFAPAVHEHNYIKSVDKRDVKPNGLVPRSLALYFAEYTSNPNAVNYQDLLVLNGWEDGSGGLVNALRFDKDLKHIEHLQAAPGTTDWGTPSTLAYREDLMSGAIDPGEYITNADTLGKNGFYNVPSSWVGSVFTGTDGANQGYLNHTIWNSSYAMQTFMPVNTADGNKTGLWYRRKTVGEWSGWMRTWGTENDQPIMIMRGIVPPGANLDLYDHPGMYSLTESASYLNGPGLDWAVMVVSRSAVHYVVQEVTGISSAGKRYRTRTESGAWSEWRSILSGEGDIRIATGAGSTLGAIIDVPYTSPWARGYTIRNGNGNKQFQFGAYGNGVNGELDLAFIGFGPDPAANQIMTFYADGTMRAKNRAIVPNLNAELHAGKTLAEVVQGSLAFAVTTGTAPALAASITPAPAALSAGLRVSIKAHVATTGPVTLNLSGLGAKSIKKPNGNNPPLVLGGVYTVVYDGSAFILQGEGGEYGTAVASQVLTGYLLGTEAGVINGSMPNRSAENNNMPPQETAYWAPGVGGSNPTAVVHFRPPAGYYNGSTWVSSPAPDLLANNLPNDKNIFGMQGSMPRQSAYTAPASTAWDGNYLYVRIPQGAYQTAGGSGYPEIQLSAAQARADGNIVASNIRAGVWVYGVLGTLIPGPSRRTVSTSGSAAAAGNTGSILSIGACPQGFSFIGTGNGLRIVGTSIVQIFDASGNYVNILSNASINRTDVISSILIDPASDLIYFCVNGAIGQIAISGNNLNVNTPLYLNMKGGVTANTFTLQGTMLY